MELIDNGIVKNKCLVTYIFIYRIQNKSLVNLSIEPFTQIMHLHPVNYSFYLINWINILTFACITSKEIEKPRHGNVSPLPSRNYALNSHYPRGRHSYQPIAATEMTREFPRPLADEFPLHHLPLLPPARKRRRKSPAPLRERGNSATTMAAGAGAPGN